MKKFFFLILIAFLTTLFLKTIPSKLEERKKIKQLNQLVEKTNQCIESENWICAEKSIRILLEKNPEDKNLKTHLAGALFEQGKYTECMEWIDGLSFSNADLDFLNKKAKQLQEECEFLNIEDSRHFRLEFEGNPKRTDIIEALTVLEIAFDSLCKVFDYYPENKIHLVLYQSEKYQGLENKPEWVAAIYDGKLRIPVNVMENREFYRPMFFHELTHAFIRSMNKKNVPLWIHEGIAQIIDGKKRNSEKPVFEIQAQDLTTLFVKENNQKKASALYWYSLQMVRFLIQKNNSFTDFRDFILNLSDKNIEELLRKYYGISFTELFENVKNSE